MNNHIRKGSSSNIWKILIPKEPFICHAMIPLLVTIIELRINSALLTVYQSQIFRWRHKPALPSGSVIIWILNTVVQHSKSEPFLNQIGLGNLITGNVLYSDPHCIIYLFSLLGHQWSHPPCLHTQILPTTFPPLLTTYQDFQRHQEVYPHPALLPRRPQQVQL